MELAFCRYSVHVEIVDLRIRVCSVDATLGCFYPIGKWLERSRVVCFYSPVIASAAGSLGLTACAGHLGFVGYTLGPQSDVFSIDKSMSLCPIRDKF